MNFVQDCVGGFEDRRIVKDRWIGVGLRFSGVEVQDVCRREFDVPRVKDRLCILSNGPRACHGGCQLFIAKMFVGALFRCGKI